MAAGLPDWAAARVAADPRGALCICCQNPVGETGPHGLRMMCGLGDGRWYSWCRTCDPWTDAARGIKTVDGRCVYGPIRNEGGVCQHPPKVRARKA